MLSVRCATHLWEIVPKGYDMPNKGDAAGYVDCIWRKCHAKWGMQSFTTAFCVGIIPE